MLFNVAIVERRDVVRDGFDRAGSPCAVCEWIKIQLTESDGIIIDESDFSMNCEE